MLLSAVNFSFMQFFVYIEGLHYFIIVSFIHTNKKIFNTDALNDNLGCPGNRIDNTFDTFPEQMEISYKRCNQNI